LILAGLKQGGFVESRRGWTEKQNQHVLTWEI
jgi:hypothetical protein